MDPSTMFAPSLGQGSSLDMGGAQSSSAGPAISDSVFDVGDFNYKSSGIKTETIIIFGVITLIGIWLWKKK